MHQIEIDFEVFKELTLRRPEEAVTYNDVIRKLLNLPANPQFENSSTQSSGAWVLDNTSFPTGSRFLATYKGKDYGGVVENGKLALSDGSTFPTPSAAAVHITGSNVNGWRFWKCKLPSASQYVLLERLRGRRH